MAPTTSLNTTQAGAQITRGGYHWGTGAVGAAAGPISFGFRQSAPSYNDPDSNPQGTFQPVTAAQMGAARAALGLWSSYANITFTDVAPGGYTGNATILFANYSSSTDGAQAFAYYPGSTSPNSAAGDVWLNTRYASTTSLPYGSYDFLTLIHETGHAIGLQHPGDYNAGPDQVITYQNSAAYIEDSQQYTVMSYFDASQTGANHVYNGRTIYASTPLMDDIAAVQRLYGANLSTAAGNTVYGFHSNADPAYRIAAATQQVVFCIWDGGGSDTLDASGYADNQTINLNPGSFSNIGALTKNVSIALGAWIESALGGSGNDVITGNDLDNFLTGGPGDDILDGGRGFNTATYSGTAASYSITSVTAGVWRVADLRAGQPDGTDTVEHIQVFQFSDTSITMASPAPIVANDFNADTRSDFLLRSGSGETAFWLISGGSISQQSSVRVVDGSWHIQATGDFGADGFSDVVWRNDSGLIYLWQMNGLQIKTEGAVRAVDRSWHVQDTGDLNGDGKSDVLWRHDTGTVYLWEMNGAQISAEGVVRGVDNSWHIEGTGDFDGDGKSDVLWRNDNGQVYIWQMDGVAIRAEGVVRQLDNSWHIEGTGDFDGDGKSDVLWRNDNGLVYIWQMDGLGIKAEGSAGTRDTAWHVQDTGDFDGDGKADIVWRSDSGQVSVSHMNGLTVASETSIGQLAAGWSIAGHHYDIV